MTPMPNTIQGVNYYVHFISITDSFDYLETPKKYLTLTHQQETCILQELKCMLADLFHRHNSLNLAWVKARLFVITYMSCAYGTVSSWCSELVLPTQRSSSIMLWNALCRVFKCNIIMSEYIWWHVVSSKVKLLIIFMLQLWGFVRSLWTLGPETFFGKTYGRKKCSHTYIIKIAFIF